MRTQASGRPLRTRWERSPIPRRTKRSPPRRSATRIPPSSRPRRRRSRKFRSARARKPNGHVDLLTALRTEASVFAAELRPPRAELAAHEGMDAWIDTYHAVQRLTRQGTYVFLTDSAVGMQEEDNLRHLVLNLGTNVPRERIVPFLTAKHSLEYCLSYAERAHQHGFPALVVLGGDKSVGVPRVVEHAWQLRRMLREHDHTLALGGWANPHADPERQVEYLAAPDFRAEYFLTQIVSHHRIDPVARFLKTAERHRVTMPGLFGVFFYRSANR